MTPASDERGEPSLVAAVRRWTPTYDLDLGLVLGVFARPRPFPTYLRASDGAIWRATRTPEGPATQRLERLPNGDVESRSWGPGAAWVAQGLPSLLGSEDDGGPLDPALLAASPFPAVRESWRRYGHRWRVPRSGVVLESLVLAVLEQRVTGRESVGAWRALLRHHGEPAPGPAGVVPPAMIVPPDAAGWARVPSWDWHRAGVDGARSRAAVTAARAAGRLEQCVGMSHVDARARLRAVPGVGEWTAAEVAVRALGDPDAVSFGDAHLAANVVHGLTGDEDGDDAALAQLLAPYEGQRYRLVRMVELSMPGRPRRGPRYSPHDFRAM